MAKLKLIIISVVACILAEEISWYHTDKGNLAKNKQLEAFKIFTVAAIHFEVSKQKPIRYH